MFSLLCCVGKRMVPGGNEMEDFGFLEDGKIPADGTMFGWDKKRKRFA